MSYTLLIHNALINGDQKGWVAVNAPYIEKIGFGDVPVDLLYQAQEIVDADCMMLLPGAIDAHVHFREPGLTHKATIESESRAAFAGGITSYIEMPNTVPNTINIENWLYKYERAEQTSLVNYSFMLGATADNIKEILKADNSLLPAVKVFMGSSTGNMLIDDETSLRKIFAEQPYRIVVHAEDQKIIDYNSSLYSLKDDISYHSLIRSTYACVKATEHAMNLAIRYGTKLHLAHISTEEETKLFETADKPSDKQITAEVSPHHLTFTVDDYKKLNARIKMNPSIKKKSDREALRSALKEGKLDIIASDHAPHLLEEKEGGLWKAVSGAPILQFSLPIMLDLFDIKTVIDKMCTGPALLFDIDKRGEIREGFYADLVLVKKLNKPHTITDSDVISKCGWTPLNGYSTNHSVIRTWVNGGTKPLPLHFN